MNYIRLQEKLEEHLQRILTDIERMDLWVKARVDSK